MKKEQLFDIIGEVEEQKILEANKDVSKKKKVQKAWLKWSALAACLCIVTVSIIGISTKKQPLIVELSNGDEVIFSTNTELYTYSLDIAIADSRDLSEAEANAIFGNTDIEAYISFEEGSNEFIILDGKIDGFSISVHRKDIPSCIEIEGEESLSYINNIPVTTGYDIIKSNGIAVVYGEFEVGNYRIHLETAGDKSELEPLCNELAKELYKLIENSSLDFELVKHSNS